MENRSNLTSILDRQITDLQNETNQNKLDIAEAFVRVEDSMNNGEIIPKDISAIFKDMSNLRMFTGKLKVNQAKLEVLIKSKLDVEKSYLEELARV